MSSWKDLYSEVKQRKMEALNKKDVVKAVEEHGKILAVEGRYEKPKKITRCGFFQRIVWDYESCTRCIVKDDSLTDKICKNCKHSF